MEWLDNLLFNPDSIAHIVLLYSLVISIGVLLGRIRIFGVSLGVTFILFVGILMGHFGFSGNLQIINFVQEEAMHIIKDFDINYQKYDDNLYVMDSVESTSALLYKAVHAGATIFNCYSVEDVIFKNNVVSGVVVNWTPVLREGMHVDPLNIIAHLPWHHQFQSYFS